MATIVVNKTASQFTGLRKAFKINDGLIGTGLYPIAIGSNASVVCGQWNSENSTSTLHPLLLVKF